MTTAANDCPMILRSAKAGGYIRVNRAFSKKVGFDPSELAKKPLLDWIDSADQEIVRETLESAQGSCRANHRTQSGELFPLIIRKTNQGQDILVMGRCAAHIEAQKTTDDVVDEKAVSGTLHAIARIIEDQLPDYRCSILLVADGHFVRGAGPSLPEDYNDAVDGYAIGPTVGSCGTAIYWNSPVVVEDIQTDPLWGDLAELAKAAGVAACWSHPFTSRSGNVLGALALYSPVPRAPTKDQLAFLCTAARMTGLSVERWRAEEELREKRKRELELEEQLRQAAKMEAIGVLAGGVAHDFNNVLGTILGNAELAMELAPENHELKETLSEIVQASQRAGGFCQQMLAYSGSATLSTSTFELGTLVPQLNSLVQAAVSKKTNLIYELHEGPIFVDGDENQLLQVLMNLVINAADAIGDNEGEIRVTTTLSHCDVEMLRGLAPQDDLPSGEYVQVTVQDTGGGISPAKIERIFDPFFTTKATGRGLGLAAVKGIVVTHKGVIQLQSKHGEGTTFIVLLPTVESAASRETPKPAITVVQEGHKSILVVDDDEFLRAITCKFLKRQGYEVIEARDGQEGIDLFMQEPDSIDCVLLDLSMPKRSGDEVYQEIKAIQPDIPVILMSGYAEQEILDRFSGIELAGILQKPVPAKDIVKAVLEATA